MTKKIPTELYKQIMENIPICCVDFVLFHNGKVLLTLRNDEPEKGKWWIQGGRILKNELLKEAVLRKAREEIGCEVQIIKCIGTYEYFSKTTLFSDVKTGVHDIAVTYLVCLSSPNIQIKIDQAHSKYKWIGCIEDDLDPYVKKILIDAKVFD